MACTSSCKEQRALNEIIHWQIKKKKRIWFFTPHAVELWKTTAEVGRANIGYLAFVITYLTGNPQW